MGTLLSRRSLNSAVLMGLLFIALIGSLYVLGTLALRLDQFGHLYRWLVAANALAIGFIAVLIGINGWRLLNEWRAQVAGSRLTVKLVVLSVVLALVPLTLLYGFSVRFLRANINSYFDVEIERALEDALELGREALALQMRTLQRDTMHVADQLVGVNESISVVVLNALSSDTEASEMTLIGPDNRIIASTGLPDSLEVQPERPDDDLLARARQGISYVGVDPVGERELYIRVVTPVLSEDPTIANSVLHALYPIAQRSSELAESIQSSYQEYRKLSFLRRPLIVNSMLTLSLALLLSVMMAVWFAFYAARRVMAPVHDLVEGTRAVAGGDLGTRLRNPARDELGFLVRSFNHMTLQLEQARDQTEQSKQIVQQQHAYLQAVLSRISSGVITLDAAGAVRTANEAAGQLLGEELHYRQGLPLDAGDAPERLRQFAMQVLPVASSGADDWQVEVEIPSEDGQRYLLCRGAPLMSAPAVGGDGLVLVIDDMSDLISAQREAAWSEVARRLAHEFKNPLTPIQLSAERLRRKLSRKLDPDGAELLGRLTETIENQVSALKSMVNAFAEYASAPRLALTDTDINAILREVAELYREQDQPLRIELALDAALPPARVDRARIRQLMHNLVKNAIEAQQEQPVREVRIITREMQLSRQKAIEIITQDRGPGFPQDMLGRIFEPYVTSKHKGTGLGLAIVRKIVEEHNGRVHAANRPDGGAQVAVVLPLAGAQQIEGDAA